jgi:uncharacterized membrane protein
MPGLPLHPLVVHFPIALYLLGVLLTLGYLWRGAADYERFAYWSFTLSWLGVVVAALVGLIDLGSLAPDDPRRPVVNNHITAGVALLILNGLVVYYRFRWPGVLTGSLRWQYLALVAAGTVALVISGWLGGELVYTLGVGVRRAAN